MRFLVSSEYMLPSSSKYILAYISRIGNLFYWPACPSLWGTAYGLFVQILLQWVRTLYVMCGRGYIKQRINKLQKFIACIFHCAHFQNDHWQMPLQLTLIKHFCNLKAVSNLSWVGLIFITEWTEEQRLVQGCVLEVSWIEFHSQKNGSTEHVMEALHLESAWYFMIK